MPTNRLKCKELHIPALLILSKFDLQDRKVNTFYRVETFLQPGFTVMFRAIGDRERC